MFGKGWKIPRLPLAIAWTLLIIGVSSIPRLPEQAPPLFHYDKIFHLIEYGILAWLWGDVLRRSARPGLRRWAWAIVIAGGLLYGAIDEFYQGTVGRSRDRNDWLADGAGVAIAQVIQETRARKKREG
ncbi:MAG: VanZ family protein [Candidatus Eisenbacteria bacterium]